MIVAGERAGLGSLSAFIPKGFSTVSIHSALFWDHWNFTSTKHHDAFGGTPTKLLHNITSLVRQWISHHIAIYLFNSSISMM